jgi:hypothetical protein
LCCCCCCSSPASPLFVLLPPPPRLCPPTCKPVRHAFLPFCVLPARAVVGRRTAMPLVAIPVMQVTFCAYLDCWRARRVQAGYIFAKFELTFSLALKCLLSGAALVTGAKYCSSEQEYQDVVVRACACASCLRAPVC